MQAYDPTLTDDEKAELEYLADKYTNVELVYDLDGKCGAVFTAPLYVSAFLGDVQENGYVIAEIRTGDRFESDGIEIVVDPARNRRWADAHESPLRP